MESGNANGWALAHRMWALNCATDEADIEVIGPSVFVERAWRRVALWHIVDP